jgi:multidrug transporter EmrE-like cation transporter
MKDIYIATGVITITAVVEAIGLYFIRLGGSLNVSIASILYAFGVVPFLSWASKYEGIGLANFMWNVLSTIFGFIIGILMFKEKIHNMQIMGVLVSLVGVAMILLAPDVK